MNAHSEKDRDYHNLIATEYHRIVVEPRAFANDVLFSKFDPLIGKGRLMLDIGCGTGHMLLRYAGRFRHALGVDHSASMLKVAEKNAREAGLENVELQCDDLLGFVGQAKDRFDLITCVGCLHHLEPSAIEFLFGRVLDLMSSDGLLLIAEPIAVDPSSQPEAIAQWNAASIGPKLGYSVVADDPDEEPLDLGWLTAAISRNGLSIEATERGWELFPKSLPPSAADRKAIYDFHHKFGSTGYVYSALIGRAR